MCASGISFRKRGGSLPRCGVHGRVIFAVAIIVIATSFSRSLVSIPLVFNSGGDNSADGESCERPLAGRNRGVLLTKIISLFPAVTFAFATAKVDSHMVGNNKRATHDKSPLHFSVSTKIARQRARKLIPKFDDGNRHVRDIPPPPPHVDEGSFVRYNQIEAEMNVRQRPKKTTVPKIISATPDIPLGELLKQAREQRISTLGLKALIDIRRTGIVGKRKGMITDKSLRWNWKDCILIISPLKAQRLKFVTGQVSSSKIRILANPMRQAVVFEYTEIPRLWQDPLSIIRASETHRCEAFFLPADRCLYRWVFDKDAAPADSKKESSSDAHLTAKNNETSMGGRSRTFRGAVTSRITAMMSRIHSGSRKTIKLRNSNSDIAPLTATLAKGVALVARHADSDTIRSITLRFQKSRMISISQFSPWTQADTEAITETITEAGVPSLNNWIRLDAPCSYMLLLDAPSATHMRLEASESSGIIKIFAEAAASQDLGVHAGSSNANNGASDGYLHKTKLPAMFKLRLHPQCDRDPQALIVSKRSIIYRVFDDENEEDTEEIPEANPSVDAGEKPKRTSVPISGSSEKTTPDMADEVRMIAIILRASQYTEPQNIFYEMPIITV